MLLHWMVAAFWLRLGRKCNSWGCMLSCLWKLISKKVNFENSAKDAIASLMNSSWTEKAQYAAMTHTETRSSPYLHECAHTAATLDKLVRNWASGESLTLSMHLGPPDRSYTLNSVDSKESNLWLSQSGLIRSVRLNVFGRRLGGLFGGFYSGLKSLLGRRHPVS